MGGSGRTLAGPPLREEGEGGWGFLLPVSQLLPTLHLQNPPQGVLMALRYWTIGGEYEKNMNHTYSVTPRSSLGGREQRGSYVPLFIPCLASESHHGLCMLFIEAQQSRGICLFK